MKIIDYSAGFDIPLKFRILSDELLSSVDAVMKQKYANYEKDGVAVVMRQLPYVLFALKGDVKGKVVVDLGCGSRKAKDNLLSNYEPWLCRILHEAGVMVIGVDAYDSSEEFRFYVKDLFLDKVDRIADVDVVHCSSLFDSPTLLHKHGIDAGARLKEKLILQCERVLRKDGVFLFA